MKSEKLGDLQEEIRLTKENIRLLKKAKKTCTCESQKPHYHALINYDSESGDAYFEKSEPKHRRFIERLSRTLVRLESRLAKLKTKESR